MSSPPGGDNEIFEPNEEVNNIITNNVYDPLFIPGDCPQINNHIDGEKYIEHLFNQYTKAQNQYQWFGPYLKDNLSINTAKLIIDKNSYCNCCAKHSYLRPNKFEKFNYPIGFVNKTTYKDTSCQCKCRHTSRFLCGVLANETF